MIDDIKRFAGDLATSKGLSAELSTIQNTPESVVAFANSKGYDFDLVDVQEYTKVGDDGELSEAQLESVAGGAWLLYTTSGGTSTFAGTKSNGSSFIYKNS